MTQQKVQKLLYLLSFFSFLVLMVEILTTPYIWGFFRIAPYMLLISIIGTILVLMLVAAPFLKQNKILFFVPIVCILGGSYENSITAIYGYYFSGLDLVAEGIVPGVLISFSYVLMDTTGLILLILRCVGYIKEHRAGLDTKF